MISKTQRLGFLTAIAAAVVGGAAVFAEARPAAAACTTATPCYVLAVPDLVVTNILADNQGGGKTKMTYMVKNQGTAAASPFVHRLQVAGSGPWLTFSGIIAAGATKTYTLTINTPGGAPVAKAVQVCADATNSEFELNEGNNCLTKTLNFGVIDDFIAPY